MIELNTLYNELNTATMSRMADNSIDSVVTDPPYEIGFMGKKWDNTGISYSVEFWKEVFRVLKPGGHLLSFSSSRTYHRMTCAIEDAGFEIRDMVEWMYGSGFPKSLDISKALDKRVGAEREVSGVKPGHEDFANRGNLSSVQSLKGTLGGSGGFDRPWMNDPEKVERYHMATSPATDAAKQWSGWGTALKPAHEPICLARKPLECKTVAENVLKYGTGGINVDGCRVEYNSLNDKEIAIKERPNAKNYNNSNDVFSPLDGLTSRGCPSGRFPANLIHDGSPEVLAMFPVSSTTGVRSKPHLPSEAVNTPFTMGNPLAEYTDSGSTARFFYCAKASGSERNEGCEEMDDVTLFKTTGKGLGNSVIRCPEHDNPIPSGSNNYTCGCPIQHSGDGFRHPQKNHHPTVKPISLMKYLVTLITPPGGTVYDPFVGSGSTLIPCKQLGFKFIGSELQAEYCDISNARLAATELIEPEYIKQLTLAL